MQFDAVSLGLCRDAIVPADGSPGIYLGRSVASDIQQSNVQF